MKKCFNGRIYDTDKSQRIACNYSETLYRTNRTKEFYLIIDDTKHLIPFSEMMAKDWLYNYTPDELAKLFPGWEPLET